MVSETAQRVTFWSGNVCQIPGMYESDCPCARVITVNTGDDFPDCADCSQMVAWELLGRTKGAWL